MAELPGDGGPKTLVTVIHDEILRDHRTGFANAKQGGK
jgi:hypothetical protein